ncbi:MAG: chromosomal replication initiator protein DnaA [Candidatus Omnitrophica bacterium]|nr:chromosomal replication initiator protein DnaA [Candidatus Omnitrophota bacterium]
MKEKNKYTVWSLLMEAIQKKIHPRSYETWFSILKPWGLDDNTLIIETPDQFFSEWLKERYGKLLKEALQEIGLGSIKIDFTSLENIETKAENLSANRLKKEEERLRLNPLYTFENFVVGPSNRFAHAASLAVAESPARAYNPLFIYGGVGLGKTHLLQAIAHYIYSKNAQVKMVFISSEDFTNQLITAIQTRTTNKFRERYRNIDVLLIDDIYFIAGKESTQEEFFHTFNALYDAHKQIVLSSDRSPKNIQGLEERLVSRFGWGLVTDIQPPDFETRSAILKKKAELANLEVPQEVIFFISEKIKNNIRDLEGALVRVLAHAQLIDEKISLEMAQKVLKDMIIEEEKKITVDTIQKKVADYFNIRFSDMRTKRRNQAVVLPRQIAMYLSRELTDLSFPDIGMYFGGKDHTTVLHAWNKIRNDLELKKELKEILQRLVEEIKKN